MAVGSSLCSSAGLVVSKYGMAGYDAFATTQIRLVAGMAGFTVLITLLGRWVPGSPRIRSSGMQTEEPEDTVMKPSGVCLVSSP